MGEGFDALLETLDTDRDRAAVIYLRLRERIERFFEWRNCEDAQELADIVIARTAKKIADGEAIMNVEAYCVSVAKFVLLDDRRNALRKVELAENVTPITDHYDGGNERMENQAELRNQCLESCLGELAMAVKSAGGSCCGPSCCSTEDPITGNLYKKDETAGLPKEAVASRPTRFSSPTRPCATWCARARVASCATR